MKASFLLLVFAVNFSSNLWAGEVLSQYDENCRFVYRSAYLELADDVDVFNQKIISKYEMSARLASLAVEITSTRASCDQLETGNNKKCVSDYQDLYSSLREKLNIPAIMSGRQTKVDRGLFGSDKAKELLKLGMIDMQCRD